MGRKVDAQSGEQERRHGEEGGRCTTENGSRAVCDRQGGQRQGFGDGVGKRKGRDKDWEAHGTRDKRREVRAATMDMAKARRGEGEETLAGVQGIPVYRPARGCWATEPRERLNDERGNSALWSHRGSLLYQH